jgi:citrate lyase beta subunit
MEKMHHKAAASKADVVMLDLEDSVPLEAKERARDTVVKSLQTILWSDKTVTARINGLDTAFGYRDLLVVAEEAGPRLESIVIPKVDHEGDVHFADRMLSGIERHLGLENAIGIEAIIESASGMEQVPAIARASGRLRSLVFGVADYSASVGARLVSISGHGEKEEETYPGHRWHFPISRMVMAAKANGLLAIDAPYGNFKDVQGLQHSAVTACALGCDGKWVIHPSQIETVNAVFSPSAEDIDRASKVLAAAKAAETEGRGAVAVEGRMIDRATVRLARQTWEQARYLGLVE